MGNMKEVNLTNVTPAVISQLGQGGAFHGGPWRQGKHHDGGLTTLGRMWNKPICVVPVRFRAIRAS